MTREHYIRQLESLRENLLRLGSMVEHALERAMKSLETWDMALASQVVHEDLEIDATWHAIEEQVIKIIATQQPVARDVRLLSTTFAIAGELERIGDYAAGVGRRLQRITSRPALVTPPPGLSEMGKLARRMLNLSLEAFLRQEIATAHSLVKEEEQVDILEKRVRQELLTLAYNEPLRMEAVVDMLEVVHLLERVADRTTNIGERVIYLVTNTNEELNP